VGETRNCSVTICDKHVLARGLCAGHYDRLASGREMDTPIRKKKKRGETQARDECGNKQCGKCRRWLSEINFYARKEGSRGRTLDGLSGDCKECLREHRGWWRAEALYNLSRNDAASMLQEQDYSCAICLNEIYFGKGLNIDHDHRCCPDVGSCGECLRGLLCHGCNMGLGHLGDDPVRLRAAADYLDRWNERQVKAP
jgi:hypothetical protein